MKKVILSACMSIFICSGIICKSQNLNSPYLRLEFNNNSTDQSGNGNHGVIAGNPVYVNDRFNTPQSAIHLDGDGDMISLTNGIITNSAKITLSCWIKTQDVHGVIVGYQNTLPTPTVLPSQFVLPLYVDNSGKLSGKLWDGVMPNPFVSNAYINDEQWHHIALVCDSVSQKMYMDNILLFTYNSNHVKLPNSIYNQIGAGYASGLWSGVNNYWSFYTGTIDDFRIYKRALTPAEISALYNNTTGFHYLKSESEQPSIYPNPVCSELTVELPINEDILFAEIIDSDGKVINSQASVNASNSMNISVEGVPEGLHFLKLHTSLNLYVNKLVIKH